MSNYSEEQIENAIAAIQHQVLGPVWEAFDEYLHHLDERVHGATANTFERQQGMYEGALYVRNNIVDMLKNSIKPKKKKG